MQPRRAAGGHRGCDFAREARSPSCPAFSVVEPAHAAPPRNGAAPAATSGESGGALSRRTVPPAQIATNDTISRTLWRS